jgi:MYXO-CTERM domain-containing protein
LVGYTGGNICLTGQGCLLSGASPGNIVFTSANLTPTPEPTDGVLLGLAILGLAALRRRNPQTRLSENTAEQL